MLNTKINHKFNTNITLDKFGLWNIEGDRRGDIFTCLCGSLWITQEGDLRDYVLEPGQEFWVTRPGEVIIQALENSKFKFSLNEMDNHVESSQQPVHLTINSRTSQQLR